MISFATRAGVLALVLVTGFAGPVLAGVGYWGGPNCANVADIPGHFSGSYAGNDKCEAMCRAAAAVCRSSVRATVVCNQDESAGYWTTWALANCAPLSGAEKLACLLSAKQNRSSDKVLLKGLRESAISGCDGFLASCITSCSVPL